MYVRAHASKYPREVWHCLRCARKHAIIASQLGASLALLPHGSQILDQLGCYDTLETFGTPVELVQKGLVDAHYCLSPIRWVA